ncbi:MAG: DUF6702 family protein [Rhodospirillaceae bacterium]|nr:DUF6702 family protein [Rhodospirillaceae bacterium]
MTLRPTRRHAVLGLGASAVIAPARAHGMHAAFTIIEDNPRTGALEIMHRIFIQDLELLLTARAGRRVTLLADPGTQKILETYLLEIFSIKSPDGQALKPEWVGMKLNIDTVFVYQEVKNAAALPGLTINSQVLTETHPGQVNSVNITKNKRTQTLIFMSGDSAQSVTF